MPCNNEARMRYVLMKANNQNNQNNLNITNLGEKGQACRRTLLLLKQMRPPV